MRSTTLQVNIDFYFFYIPYNFQESGKFLQSQFALGFLFTKLLRNFCGMEPKILLQLRKCFARKKSILRNLAQKSFRAKFCYTAYSVLSNCIFSIPLFCNVHKINDTFSWNENQPTIVHVFWGARLCITNLYR